MAERFRIASTDEPVRLDLVHDQGRQNPKRQLRNVLGHRCRVERDRKITLPSNEKDVVDGARLVLQFDQLDVLGYVENLFDEQLVEHSVGAAIGQNRVFAARGNRRLVSMEEFERAKASIIGHLKATDTPPSDVTDADEPGMKA